MKPESINVHSAANVNPGDDLIPVEFEDRFLAPTALLSSVGSPYVAVPGMEIPD